MDWLRENSVSRGARVYTDANAWICAQDPAPRFDELREWFNKARRGEWKIVTSQLTLAECLVWPLESRDRVLKRAFEKALAPSPQLVVLPVSREILLEAAVLRAARRLEMPDAIHLASAKHARCTHFLTGDEALARAVHIPVLRLEI